MEFPPRNLANSHDTSNVKGCVRVEWIASIAHPSACIALIDMDGTELARRLRALPEATHATPDRVRA